MEGVGGKLFGQKPADSVVSNVLALEVPSRTSFTSAHCKWEMLLGRSRQGGAPDLRVVS